MVFQVQSGPSKSDSNPLNSRASGWPLPLDELVGQISEAVRERLIRLGVPVALSPIRNSESALPADQPKESSKKQDPDSLAAKIDHTLLKPDATREEIERVCAEARKHQFATVCVNSTNVRLAAELLNSCSTLPIAVVGFPLGAASTGSKAYEAQEAVRAGAREIDMVINIGALKSRAYDLVFEDIRQVVLASHPYPVKVILETSSLNEDQKIIGCALSKAAGAAFVKTSTGFGSGGATVEDIGLMRRIVGPEMGVKASGGIRTHDDAVKMLAAGASRIGASASVAIVTQTGGESKTGTSSPKKADKAGTY